MEGKYGFNTFLLISIDQVNWPVYMVEMMDLSSRHERQGSVVYDTFDISEFIYIHLVTIFDESNATGKFRIA